MSGEVRLSRRRFLLAGGVACGSTLLVGCTGGSSSTVPPPTTPSTTAPTTTTAVGANPLLADLAFAELAAAVENLLDRTYTSVLALASDGKLGTVPPAVATLVRTVQSHHRDHAAAWNAILTAAGMPEVTSVDTTFDAAVVQPGLAALKDLPGALALAARVEGVAAATYLDAAQYSLTTTGAIQTAAVIQPVEMQHVAVFNLFVDGYPVPDSFAMATGARAPGDQTG